MSEIKATENFYDYGGTLRLNPFQARLAYRGVAKECA